MQIYCIKNKDQLNKFIGSQPYSRFLQSWQWGEFQEKAGNKIIRLGVEDHSRLVAAATLIKKALPGGRSYFYCPRGPVVGNWKSEIGNLLFNKIKSLAKEENAIFLRFEPDSKLQNRINNYKLPITKTIDIQPSKTIILNIKKTEDELLKAMHQKTRYNIRLAERKGVKINEIDNSKDGFEKFWRIMEDTGRRDRFRLHKKDYYRGMIGCDRSFIKLFTAEHNNKILSANIILFFGDTATYMHGASANEHRSVMAPFLLQWRVIQEAKAKGYKYYDFYGIDEKKYPGVTRFKRGFGGEEINYPGTFDLIFSKKWYLLYEIVRKVRRMA